MISTRRTVPVEAQLVGFEVRKAVEAAADEWLQKGDERLQVFPIGPVVTGQKNGGLEAKDIRGADVIADALEMDPGWNSREPGSLHLTDLTMCPCRVEAGLMDVPVVRWRDDA